MKKNEIKKIFEENLKNIEVSSELKEKTLNIIKNKNNVYHFPYIIRNCAAIFIVTCLCLSLYLVNNKNPFNKKDIPSESNTLNSIEDTPLTTSYKTVKSLPMEKYGTLNQDFFSTNSIKAEASINEENLRIQEDSIEDLYIGNYIGLDEEEFLNINPNAKKTENGYIIIENNEEILYKISDGTISERIIK